MDRVIADPRRTVTLRKDDVVVSCHTTKPYYVNLIFDLQRAAAPETVHGHLEDIGINDFGKYGDWAHR
jgi:hypothetical protein